MTHASIEWEYRTALRTSAKAEILSVDASAGGPLERLGELPNLRSLKLAERVGITNFDFLKGTPKLRRLDLSELGLTAIPPAVGALAELEALVLDRNALTDLSPLAVLPKLVELRLREVTMTSATLKQLLSLKKLEIVDLYEGELKDLAPLAELVHLRELYASYNKIKTVPDALRSLRHLRALDVSRNWELKNWGCLTSLPLEKLSLTAWGKLVIPGEVFQMQTLKELMLERSGDAATLVLDGLGGLRRLERLCVSDSTMTKLPKAFGALASLRSLELETHTMVTDLSPLEGLSALEVLKLDGGALTTIPESFSTLKALRSVDFGWGKKLVAAPGLRDLPALEDLDLVCEAKALPGLATLTNLRRLKLSAKTSDVSFLTKLPHLTELYIGNVDFLELPALPKLEKLTLFQEKHANAKSDYLARFTSLEELEVNQATFTLPKIPSLRKLAVSGIRAELDLDAIGGLPHLRELCIDRSPLTALPSGLGAAKSLRKLTLEFLDKLRDLGTLVLPELEELTISSCKTLKLPSSFGGWTGLRRLRLNRLLALKSIDALAGLGALANLEELELDDIPIPALPASFEGLTNLRYVSLRGMAALVDVKVLAKTPKLTTVQIEYGCNAISREQIAKVRNAISARSGRTLRTSYAQFMENGGARSLHGMEDAKATYGLPLLGGTRDELLEWMRGYGWLDDYRQKKGDLGAIFTDPKSALQPLALLDLGKADELGVEIDSYKEEVFLVDVANQMNPVLVWGHDGAPRTVHTSFDDFLQSLRSFPSPKKASAKPSPEKKPASGARTYLEFKDAKSSKFWEIVVAGASHTVTFGKIGSAGTSKTTTFDSAAEAKSEADKLVQSKLKKGYAPS